MPRTKTPAKAAAVKIEVPDGPQCRTCMYWESDGNQDMGLCRRFPPSFIVEDGETSTSFAVSADNDWCGEYRRRLQG